MKKSLTIAVVCILVFISSVTAPMAHALPTGSAQHSGRYFLGDEDLGRWSIGASYLDRDRNVTTLNRTTHLRSIKTAGYVGYDLIYGMTGYLILGSTESRFERWFYDSHAEYGWGLQFNILDHEIPDPTLMEDRLRINASFLHTKSGATWGPTEVRWDEFFGSLTISFVNDIWGNKYYNFNNIAFYFGMVGSYLHSSSIEADTNFGYCAGVEISITEKISVELGMESIDKGSIYGGINIGL